MSKEFDVHYGDEEFRTVDAGIEAIEAVLTGEDIHRTYAAEAPRFSLGRMRRFSFLCDSRSHLYAAAD